MVTQYLRATFTIEDHSNEEASREEERGIMTIKGGIKHVALDSNNSTYQGAIWLTESYDTADTTIECPATETRRKDLRVAISTTYMKSSETMLILESRSAKFLARLPDDYVIDANHIMRLPGSITIVPIKMPNMIVIPPPSMG